MGTVAGLVLGLAGLLALIAFLPPLATRLRLPFTVVLALVGAGLGLAIGLANATELGGLDRPLIEFLRMLGGLPITAEIFLWVLVPILLFEASVNLDVRDMQQDLGPILVLAILAVLLCTALAGAAVWAVGLYGLVGCFLIASIIATTDPSAVIAVFREVGAPRRLVTLVEGESLLNDAAAIALFTALLAAVTSAAIPTPAMMAREFIGDFTGGILVGAVLGRAAGFLVSRLDEGGPAEVTLSVAVAYLAYGIADFSLGVSGVIAVVIAGLVFGTYGRTSVGAREWQSVTTIWNQLGFWASSLIFILASMLVPATLRSATWVDLGGIVILVLGALAARTITLYGILPAVSRVVGYQPIDGRYKAVIIWGGLRGAVTLALALAVSENAAVPADLRHFVSVLATGFVLFTLFVQGMSLRWLIRRLGLDRLSPVERLIRRHALEVARAEVRDRVSEAAITHGLDLGQAGDLDEVLGPPAEPEPSEEILREQVVTALATVTTREIQLYVEGMARRMMSRKIGAYAINDAGGLLDALRSDGFQGYRQAVRKLNEFDRRTRIAAWLHRRLRLQRPLASRLAARIELFLVKRQVIEELIGFDRTRIRALFGVRVAQRLERILQARLDQIDRVLDGTRLQYPTHWEEAARRYLGRIAVRLEMDRYQRMREERLLTPQLFQDLMGHLRERRRELDRTPPLDLGLDLVTMIRQVPLFAGLPDEQLARLRRLLMPRLALPGEHVVRRNEPGDAMYFIASGAVEVRLPREPVRLGTGDFFGEMALIRRARRTADVVAIGYCQLLEMPRDAFRELLRTQPELMREVRRVADIRLRGAHETAAEPAPPAGQPIQAAE